MDASNFASVVGIAVGSQACVYSVLQPDKRIIVKPTEVANREPGFVQLHASLSRLAVPPQRILLGLEATSRYRENLYQFLAAQGYVLWRLASAPNASVRESRVACVPRPIKCQPPRLPAAW